MLDEFQNVRISMDCGLKNRLRVSGLLQKGIRVTSKRGETLTHAIAASEAEMRSLYGQSKPSEIPGLKSARQLFRSIGVDPTRMRPASEALLRRILKGQDFPAINSAVDAANLISLRYMIPVGLYDRDKVRGEVEIRLGEKDECYQRIGEGVLNLEGRLGLFDEAGGFGNPTGDSRRTRVGEETRNLLFIAFFPASHAMEEMKSMIEYAGGALSDFTGGSAVPLGDGGLIPF